ncbi:MORN repeat-containing protein 1 isoform X2 [Grus americana]|uniref:MORN repeat-containing protein 1 isoform X2 n=1 Tax=Grus americana TaxID=9117 RepID=UPI00240827C0|nr:MORN repeat-containing protein 1 isoform X2 [Grus americana]
MLGINSVLSRKKFFESRSVPVSCSRKEFLLFLFVPVQNYERAKQPSGNGLRHTCDLHLTDVFEHRALPQNVGSNYH